MKTFLLKREIWLPRPRAEVFAFFSEARNLQTITPDWLKFEVLTPGALQMRVGLLIDYRITVHGFPIRWRTEIAEWNPPDHFTDIQLRGPYSVWRHHHTFVERDGGTLCGDEVLYRPKGGWLMDWLFVRRDLHRIFSYREQRLVQMFGPSSTGSGASGSGTGS